MKRQLRGALLCIIVLGGSGSLRCGRSLGALAVLWAHIKTITGLVGRGKPTKRPRSFPRLDKP